MYRGLPDQPDAAFPLASKRGNYYAVTAALIDMGGNGAIGDSYVISAKTCWCSDVKPRSYLHLILVIWAIALLLL